MNRKKDSAHRAFAPSEELVDKFLKVSFTVGRKSARIKNNDSLEDRIIMKRNISRQVEDMMKIFYDFCVAEKKQKIPIIRNGILSDRMKQEIITNFRIGSGADKVINALQKEMFLFFSKERRRVFDDCKIYAKRNADIVLEISA